MPNTIGEDDDGGSGVHEGGQASSASETIAALWRQREEEFEAVRPAQGPLPPPAPPPRRPRTASGRGAGRLGIGVGTMAAVVAGALVLAGGVGYLLANRTGGPSRGSFAAQADAVCLPAAANLSITRPTSYPELAAAAAIFSAAIEGELGQLRQIPVPGGRAGAEARTVVADYAATTVAAKALHEAAVQKDDTATVNATTKLSTAASDTAGTAGAYGMTACGSDLRPTVQTLAQGAQTVVKAGFFARADVLCRAASDEFDAIGEPPLDAADDLSGYLEAILAIQVRLGDELRALPVPPGDEATVAEMLDAYDKITAMGRTMTAAVANGDEAGFVVATREITTLGPAADAKLDGYGLGVCGSNFGNV